MPIEVPRLRADEIGVPQAARELELSYTAVVRLIAEGTLQGGRRQLPRTSPLRPWSRSATHTQHFVLASSVERFRLEQPGRLLDLQQRRAKLARAVKLGQRRARAAARAVASAEA